MASASKLGRWGKMALGLIYPHWCQVCRQHPAIPERGYVCDTCSTGPQGVKWIRPPFCDRCGLPYQGQINTDFRCSNCAELSLSFSQARAAVVATELVLEVIHQYKYNRSLWFEPFLADLLVDAAAGQVSPDDWDLIVPVPLHPVREREREFNQAERLADHLSRATRVPLNARLAKRVECTQTQTMLTREERAKNVKGAFFVRNWGPLEKKRVVVVDDVLTTGSTTSACSRALLDAGAAKVSVWTLARGL